MTGRVGFEPIRLRLYQPYILRHEAGPPRGERVAGRLPNETRNGAHRFQCVELRHVGSWRLQLAAPRRQAVDDGSTANTDEDEIRTAASPSSAVQCVFSGGPYTTASHVRQCQLVCPPPPWPRHATCPTRT